MPTINKNTIIFDKKDWLGGVDYLRTGADFETEGNGLALGASFDPIRLLGHASPGTQWSDATNQNLVTDVLVNGVQKNENGYILSTDGKIFELTGLNAAGTLTSTATFPHTIAGVTPSGSDCVKYYVNTGTVGTPVNVEYLFYSYSTSTFWDVGRYDFSGMVGGFNDTYMSATASPALGAPFRADGGEIFSGSPRLPKSPHPMVVGDNNILYIGDRNYVHAFDGQIPTVGSFTSNVFDIPTGFIITALVNWKNYLVVFAYKRNTNAGGTFTSNYLGEARAFFWDTFSDSFTFAVDLKDNYVSEAVNFNNTIACFTSGSPDTLYTASAAIGGLRLKTFNGESFVTTKTFSAPDIPRRGGVQVINNDIYWNSGGYLFSYVNLEGKYIINELNSVSGNSGMLRAFSSFFNFHLSRGTGSGSGLVSFLFSTATYHQSCNLVSKAVEPIFPDYSQGRIKKIKVTYLKPSSGGRALTLQTYRDTTSTDTIISAKQTVTSLVEEYFVDTSNNPLQYFKQLQLYLIWGTGSGSSDAPIITRVEVEFETIKIQ